MREKDKKKAIKLIIVDDHQMFLEGISALIENNDDIKIIGIAKNGVEGLLLLKKEQPDIVLTDIEMPNMGGLDFAKKIKSINPSIKIIALTAHCNGTIIDKVRRTKIDGYLYKKTGRMELLNAIYSVYNGYGYYSLETMEMMRNSLLSSDLNNEVINLSPREKEVLKLICKEKKTSKIAEELHISVNTVESHRKNLMRKLGAKNMIGLVKYAINNNMT